MGTGAQLILRQPATDDGAAVWELIKTAGTLDLNSAYCYLLLCDLFRNTCVVAERSGKIVGFTSAFVRPDREDTLFIWQTAVHQDERGKGLAKIMLSELLLRNYTLPIRYLEATVSPSNQASNRLFTSIASVLETSCSVAGAGYPSAMFPPGASHEDEPLLRIGPFQDQSANIIKIQEEFDERIREETAVHESI